MDTRTNEIFDFASEVDLNKAKAGNPYLVEVSCDKLCEYRKRKDNRSFCIANRRQRRALKCTAKK